MTTAPAPVRWGVIGATSWVATEAVLPALAASPTAELTAVASRDPKAAAAVAARFGAGRAHRSYDELLEDGAIEAVYIPLPNALHAEWTVRAAAAGKHVLCEKPLALGEAQGQAMAEACSAAGVQLVEAYMTPHHPRTQALLEICRGGELGDLIRIDSMFTFPLEDAGNHRWRADMGGGALLDVGVYVLAPLLAIDARPRVDAATARRAPGGVDATTSARLWLAAGGVDVVGDVLCSFEAPELQRLEMVGSRAAVRVERPFTPGPGDTDILVRRRDGGEEVRRVGGANPYLGMVEHCAAVVRGTAAPRRPVAEVLASLAVLDRIAAATGPG